MPRVHKPLNTERLVPGLLRSRDKLPDDGVADVLHDGQVVFQANCGKHTFAVCFRPEDTLRVAGVLNKWVEKCELPLELGLSIMDSILTEFKLRSGDEDDGD